jgi:hypothetical protein
MKKLEDIIYPSNCVYISISKIRVGDKLPWSGYKLPVLKITRDEGSYLLTLRNPITPRDNYVVEYSSKARVMVEKKKE